MTKEEVIKKIKKLLALSASANMHEAAIAMRHAEALMREHRIDAAAIDIEQCEVKAARGKDLRYAPAKIAVMVAWVYGAYFYVQTRFSLGGTVSNYIVFESDQPGAGRWILKLLHFVKLGLLRVNPAVKRQQAALEHA